MDTDGFINRVLPLRDKIFRLLKRLCHSRADAEDMTQEVLMKLWLRRLHLTEVRNLEAFVLTVAKNQYIDKQKGKISFAGLQIPETENVAAFATHHQSDGAMVLLDNIIARLPEQQRLVLHLRDIEGMEFEEMAAITGMTANHLRVVLSRARGAVRSELTKLHSYGTRKG